VNRKLVQEATGPELAEGCSFGIEYSEKPYHR